MRRVHPGQQPATGYELGYAGWGMSRISLAIAEALRQQPDHLSVEEALYILADTVSGMTSILETVARRAAAEPKQVHDHTVRAAERLHEQVKALLAVAEGAQTFVLRRREGS